MDWETDMGDFSRMKHYVMKLENTNIVIIDIDVENLHQATKNLVGFLDFFSDILVHET